MTDSSLLAAWSAAMMSWYICVKEGRRGKEKTENDHPYPGGPLHVGLQARSLQSAKRLPRLYLQNPKGCWHATVFEWNRGSQVKQDGLPGQTALPEWWERFFWLDGSAWWWWCRLRRSPPGCCLLVASCLLQVPLDWGTRRRRSDWTPSPRTSVGQLPNERWWFQPTVNEQAFWDTSCPNQYTWWQWRSWLDIGTSIPRRLILMS